MPFPAVAGIMENSTELDRIREELKEVVLEINTIHMKLKSNPEVVENDDDNSLSNLKMLYIQAKELSESEVTISTRLLEQLDALIDLGNPGRSLRRIDDHRPRKTSMRASSDVSRMHPYMRSHLESLANLKGEQVAARVNSGNAQWVVVRVIQFDKETREFIVLDEEPGEDEESNGQRTYKLPISHIIPFPKRTVLSSAHNIPPGKFVLAVYPETTTLYKATVMESRKRKTDDYVLEFDDEEGAADGSLLRRLVPFNMVVPLPEGYQK